MCACVCVVQGVEISGGVEWKYMETIHVHIHLCVHGGREGRREGGKEGGRKEEKEGRREGGRRGGGDGIPDHPTDVLIPGPLRARHSLLHASTSQASLNDGRGEL